MSATSTFDNEKGPRHPNEHEFFEAIEAWSLHFTFHNKILDQFQSLSSET